MKFHLESATGSTNLFLMGKIERGDPDKLKPVLEDLPIGGDFDAIFNSPGGSIIASFRIQMLLNQNHIYRSLGEIGVHSSAIIPFLMGYERYANKNTEFLFHYPEFDKEASKREVAQKIKDIQSFISECTNLTPGDVDRLMKFETRVSAQGAKDYGIIMGFC